MIAGSISGPKMFRYTVSNVFPDTTSAPPGGGSAQYVIHRSSEATVFPDRTAPVQRLIFAVDCAIDCSCLSERALTAIGVAVALLIDQVRQQTRRAATGPPRHDCRCSQLPSALPCRSR